MDISTYYSVLEDLAKRHKVLRHQQPNAPGDSILRNSFHRGASEKTFSNGTNGSYPCMIAYNMRGRLELGSALHDNIVCSFEIRAKVSDQSAQNEKETAHQLCKNIGLSLIAEIQLMNENDPNGPFPSFDINTVQYSLTGPLSNNEYGCYFFWSAKDEAYDFYGYDSAEHFENN